MSGFNPSDEKWRIVSNYIAQKLITIAPALNPPVAGMAQGAAYAYPMQYGFGSNGTMTCWIDVPGTWRFTASGTNAGSVKLTGATGLAGAGGTPCYFWAGDITRNNARTAASASTGWDPYAAIPSEDTTSNASETASATKAVAVGSWGRLRILECQFIIYDPTGAANGTTLSSATSADTRAGIGFGFQIAGAANLIVTAPGYATILLYFDFNTLTWYLLSSQTGVAGTTSPTVPLQGVDPPVPNRIYNLRLAHDPLKGKITGWINGVEGASIVDPSKVPLANTWKTPSSANTCQPVVFAQAGNSVGAQLDVQFANLTEHIVMPWR
jgi:hypothetical protein